MATIGVTVLVPTWSNWGELPVVGWGLVDGRVHSPFTSTGPQARSAPKSQDGVAARSRTLV